MDENEEVEDEIDDKDIAKKDETMIGDTEILMVDPVEVGVDCCKDGDYEERELTLLEREEVKTWEKCFDQARRSSSDRIIGSTFVALAEHDNDEPRGLDESRKNDKRFIPGKGVVMDDRKDDPIQEASPKLRFKRK